MQANVSNQPTVPDELEIDTNPRMGFFYTSTTINISHLAQVTIIGGAANVGAARAEPLKVDPKSRVKANKPWYRKHSGAKDRY
jgi:hypothetical protein